MSSLFRADSRLTPPSSERGLLQASPAVAPTSDPPTTDGGSSDITSCSGENFLLFVLKAEMVFGASDVDAGVCRGGRWRADGGAHTGTMFPGLSLDRRPARSDIISCLPQGATDSLGVSVAGGKGSPLGDIPVFIAMIQANGVAAKTHRLKVVGGGATRQHAVMRACVCVCV